jgi:hypothetical protein
MGAGELQGWQADPFRLHEARYFSAGRPTKLVRDGMAESFDEPPAGAWEPAAMTTVAPALDSAAPAQPGPGWAIPNGPAPGDPGLARRRPGPGLSVFVAIALIAAAGAIGVVAFPGARSPRPAVAPGAGLSPVAFVTQSARHTLGQQTADVTVSGSLQAGGASSPVHGSGEVNFSTSSMAVDVVSQLPGSSPPKTQTQSEIEVGGSLYLKISVNGKTEGLPGGRTWMRLPVKNAPATNITGSDPLGALTTLAAQGNTVTALGTRVIGGVTCSGYSIRPRLMPIITLTVWIDSNSLVRELGAGLQMSFNNTATSVSIVMDFTNFGTPVRISPPPPSSVISVQELLKELGLDSLASLPGLGAAGPAAH